MNPPRLIKIGPPITSAKTDAMCKMQNAKVTLSNANLILIFKRLLALQANFVFYKTFVFIRMYSL